MNARQKMDGVELLERIPRAVIDLAWLDPQYRGVLDKLAFGNEGERQGDRSKLPQQSDSDIAFMVEEIARVLRPSAHLMLWTDKFSIASAHYQRWLRHARKLSVVDLIAWNKLRPGMGRRARCVTEYLVVLQKEPVRAKDHWSDHSLRDSWSESTDRTIHAHCKPYVLTERLIRATTHIGDTVLDPCAGGYGVLEACLASGRNFVGSDLL
jgi:site-specific DNA-methyltransferase (adenine-specific)